MDLQVREKEDPFCQLQDKQVSLAQDTRSMSLACITLKSRGNDGISLLSASFYLL